jgi:hypothetical protein
MIITIVIVMGSGLTLQIPAEFEFKHYSEQELEKKCNELAITLGGTYLYWEAR